MKVSTFATPAGVADPAHSVQESYAVVIDVLRATSTIITALHNGARSVIPVSDVPEAIALTRSLDRDSVLLCGERQGVRVSGFDLGNSPPEFTSERVAGRTLVMTTTNGTRAILAVREARVAAVGGIVNATAVARRAAESGLPLTLLMAGTRNRFSLDDALAAGAILDALPSGAEPDDLGHVCRRLYRENRKDPAAALEQCSHYHDLMALGFGEDIAYCMSRDVLDTVPRFHSDHIIAG